MKKLLIANRGEIAVRLIRAGKELGIKTVAIFAKEDEFAVHRFKADESYLVGEGKAPIAAYLDIDDIIRIAKETGADAIHPGYGFLSENDEFAAAVEAAGIKFVGPRVEHLKMFGDKITAKQAAIKAGVPTVPGTDHPVESQLKRRWLSVLSTAIPCLLSQQLVVVVAVCVWLNTMMNCAKPLNVLLLKPNKALVKLKFI